MNNGKPLWMDKTPQPSKDIKIAMDYKEKQIKRFADEKQESIRLSSSGRDAAMMVTSMMNNYKEFTEEQLKEKILEWRKFFYVSIYGQNEEFYKQNNNPFN